MITIQHNGQVYEPSVIDGIKLARELGGMPATLRFKAVKDDLLVFDSGDRVKLTVDGINVFNGFIFEIKDSTNDYISFKCYDQMRYLKNKRSYSTLKNKKASDIIQMIADDFNLVCGNIADTKHQIGIYVSENQTLADLIYWYIYSTELATQTLYELYDNDGKLMLVDINAMKLDYLLDGEVIAGYSYRRSIDSDTFNAVALVKNAKDSSDGKRKYYYKADVDSVKKWGRLEYFATIEGDENGNQKASDILKAKNRETKYLTVKGALGDVRVRGGSSMVCSLTLNDKPLHNYMVVKKVTHTFKSNEHTMDLVLIGGDLIE